MESTPTNHYQHNPSSLREHAIAIGNIYGDKGSKLNLPFVLPYHSHALPTSMITFPVVPPNVVQESCGFKIIAGGAMGGVMGLGLGLFMGAVGDNSPIQVINGRYKSYF